MEGVPTQTMGRATLTKRYIYIYKKNREVQRLLQS